MTEPLNRGDIIALLQRLGGGDDAEVLEAARALHAAVAGAGTNWEALLVPEDAGDSGAEADDGVDEDLADDGVDEDVADDGVDEDVADDGVDEDVADDGVDEDVAETPAPAEPEPPAGKHGQNAKALALIDKLLARPNVTEAFREEMAGYKADIAEGDFTDADYKYLRALAKRLSGKG